MKARTATLNLKRSILVIDDGADNRLLLSATLQHAGYECLLAEHGEAGLAILATRTPTLILLDYSMPGLTGPEVACRIRARPETVHTPIILLTASGDDGHIDEAFAAGADDYIVKPFDRRILLARIASMIRAASDRARAVVATHVEAELGLMRSDLQSASAVQRDQVSKLPVRGAAWTISGAVVPCQHVGGDLLNIVVGAAGARVAIVLDISGHGTAAALVAASALADLRNLVGIHSLPEAFAILSSRMASAGSGHYACVCAIELADDRVTVVNAGLPPVCLIRDGNVAQVIQASGIPPGMFATATYVAEEIPWGPGDRLVVMSDGLTEPLGLADDVGPCFRALDLMTPGGARATDELTTQIRALLGDRAEDDATLLIIDREVPGQP
jgi:phosphoserine phosphatase RsbU/P